MEVNDEIKCVCGEGYELYVVLRECGNFCLEDSHK